MKEYKYLGDLPVQLGGFGIVNPKDVIKTKLPVNHPLFEEIVKEFKPIQIKKPVNKKNSK